MGEGALTVVVFARHRYATDDAPITGSVNVTVFDADRGIDIREAFQEFVDFGAAIELPDGTLDANIQAPGGLGGEFEGGGGRIGPSLVQNPPERTRLRLIHPDEGATFEVGLVTRTVTRGARGAELFASDEAEILTVHFRLAAVDETRGTLTFTANLGNPAGHPVQRVLPAIRLLSALKPPYEFQWLPEFGADVLASETLRKHLAPVAEHELRFLEDLSAIQDRVRGTVFVPEEIDRETAEVVRRLAIMTREGQFKGTWTRLNLKLAENVSPSAFEKLATGRGQLGVEGRWKLTIGDRNYDLGVVHQIMTTARLADDQPNDRSSLTLLPRDDDTVIQRFGPLPGKHRASIA